MTVSVDIVAEGLQFILDKNNTVIKLNLSPSVTYSETIINHTIGTPFNTFLSSLLKHKNHSLPHDWFDTPFNIELKYSNKDKVHTLMLTGIKHESYIYGQLMPYLGSNESLTQLSAEQIPLTPVAVTQLFVKFQTLHNRLNNYLNHFPGVVFSQRADGSFSYIHEHFKQWIPTPLNRFFKSTQAFLQCILEEDRANYIQYLTKKKDHTTTDTLFYRLKIAPDKTLHIMDVRTPQIAPSGLLLGYEGIWVDITRQAIAEKYLEKNSWKEHLALLTSGLLHDFSNIMAGIYSVSELYDNQLAIDHPWKNGLSQIQNSAKEAQTLVRRILELHKGIKSKRDYFNLADLIDQQKDLLKIILPKKTHFHFEYETTEFPVYIDDVRFRQILVNFAVNTRDALKDGPGEITVTLKTIASNTLLGEGFESHSITEKIGVMMCFKDNAGGIAPEILSHIFNPFFTTKESTKGSGLGLYNTQLFVEDMGGKIGVTSTLGQGTCFYIYLPLTNFDEEILPQPPSTTHEKKRNRIIVYAYEDPSFFSLVERLQETGWEVLCTHQSGELIQQLSSGSPLPDMIYFIELAADKEISTIAQTIQQTCPNIQLIKQNMSDTDKDNKTDPSLFHMIIERNTPLNEVIELLNQATQPITSLTIN